MSKERIPDQKVIKQRKPETREQSKDQPGSGEAASSLINLQQQVGNRAVQRLLAQRKGEGPYELDDETAGRISQERGGGQPLDEKAQESLGGAMGHDFSGVKVHTSPEAADLNRQLNAKAFTTGKDIFFSEGTYDPHSSGGQELLAHELTHVAQQGSGAVGGASRMTVNAPGDAFEQQADSTARAALSQGAGVGVQRATPEEEEEVQTQAEEEEEEVQTQEMPEEEEIQTAAEEEEEVQTPEVPEEEEQA
jgi:hypothetical protein